MPETAPTDTDPTLAEVRAELAGMEDEGMRAVNERHGDAHSVNLTALRRAWIADPDPVVASAGWALTGHVLRKGEEELDVPALLDVIEAQMAAAPERLQWAMNETLATIGIEVPELRERALAIGERLGVLRDHPTPAGCTSPFAPAWIAEMVRRREEG